MYLTAFITCFKGTTAYEWSGERSDRHERGYCGPWMVLATERGLAEQARARSGGVGYERAPAELIDELTGPETNWVCGARNWMNPMNHIA